MPAEGKIRDGEPAGFQLIETLRWEPGTGFLRLDRHLARLSASAAELGFAYDPETVSAALAEAVAGAASMMRVRFVLARGGEASASAQPFEPLPPDTMWTLNIARTRLDSAEPLLRHKTTRREVYARARSEYLIRHPDEVLMKNEKGELCEGTITNLFADFGEGVLLTPPLACGLLPGVLRAELLDQGRAREAVLTAEAVRDAKSLFVGNSLRGLIPSRLASFSDI